MMTVEIKQTLKAKEDVQHEQPLKNITFPRETKMIFLKVLTTTFPYT